MLSKAVFTTKMWYIFVFLLLVVVGEFRLSDGSPAANEEGPKGACYVCNGVEDCSKDLGTMKTESQVVPLITWLGYGHPRCGIIFDLTAPGGPKVLSRGPLFSSSQAHEPNCRCEEDCKQELCFCYESLCNGRDPECKFRLNATLVPGCKA